jgi:hypothetical protein
MDKYLIDSACFLIPSLLDNRFGSKKFFTSLSVGIISGVLVNGLRNHLKKKRTTKLKEAIITELINTSTKIKLVNENEIFQEEIQIILPSLQIFFGSNMLNIYFFKNLKINISIPIIIATTIFQYKIYLSLNDSVRENYSNIFTKLSKILGIYCKK